MDDKGEEQREELGDLPLLDPAEDRRRKRQGRWDWAEIIREDNSTIARYLIATSVPYRRFNQKATGWRANSLHEVEDIDFEFVYALHTFVATVEGQANASKGDTMVLLDDSNSYWWLVRVVKDSSIGYLPAEHIETPTERLARLNKHRNIDLSQTMLGDNPEKSKNPLKKAMRRRNAKSVAFAEPTFFPTPENEYSTEEENEENLEFITTAAVAQSEGESDETNGNAVDTVEPLRVGNAAKENNKAASSHLESGQSSQVNDGVGIRSQEDSSRISADSVGPQDEIMGRSNRKMRNTDSFFKDDSIEPKKINLTPSLLRDDSAASTNVTGDSRNRASMEGAPKSATVEKPKEDKRKEKKGLMSGLFSRRSRKSKSQSEDEDPEWLAKEIAAQRQSPQPKASSDSAISEPASGPSSPQRNIPVRQTSKLQKSPPTKSNSFNRGSQKSAAPEQQTSAPQVEALQQVSPLTNPFENVKAEDLLVDRSILQQSQPKPALQIPPSTAQATSNEQKSPADSLARNVFSPIRDVLRQPQTVPVESRPEKLKKATTRMTLDSSDESQDEAPAKAREATSTQQEVKETSPSKDNLSESPVHVTPVMSASQPPALATDSLSSQDEATRSLESASSSPELIERPTEENTSGIEEPSATATPASTAQSSKRSKEPDFNWARCQRWFDEEFPGWYASLMDISEEMKSFDYKGHWSYKDFLEPYQRDCAVMNKRLDDFGVDFMNYSYRRHLGEVQPHPEYRIFKDEAFYERVIEMQDAKGVPRDEYWLPWTDPEYAYLYPNREDRIKGPHVATGPPSGRPKLLHPGDDGYQPMCIDPKITAGAPDREETKRYLKEAQESGELAELEEELRKKYGGANWTPIAEWTGLDKE